LTSEAQAAICRAIRIGATREVAAQAAGVTRRTLQYWIERGKAEQERLAQKGARRRKREEPYLHFLHALEEAEAEGEVTHLETIAADGAAGSKWILSRRHPDRWAQVRKEEISGPGGKPLIPVPELTDAERARALAGFAERLSAETTGCDDSGQDQSE
jgi:hypothetical protein